MVGVIKNIIKIPKTNKGLENEAEIIGIMLGDGYIYKSGYSIRLKVRELDFINNFSKLIKQTYGLRSIYKMYDYPCSFVHSKQLATRLIILTKYNKLIPKFILRGTNKIKARFLKGFFDAEGSVDVIWNRRQIVLTQNNPKMLLQIKSLLQDLNIQSKYVKKNFGSDKVIISLLENLDKYYSLIGFSIEYKQEKLKKAIKYLKNCKAYEKEKYWQVLRHWLKNKKSIRASAKNLQMHWETYRTWIYGMKAPCQIKKDIEYGVVPKDYNKLRK